MKSGAEIIETGSYQINQENLVKHLNISIAEARDLIKKSVDVAIEARKEAESSWVFFNFLGQTIL